MQKIEYRWIFRFFPPTTSLVNTKDHHTMPLTIEKLLEAKKLFDEAKAEQVADWWNSVRFFSTWNDDCRNKKWSELPDSLKHELIGIHDSLPIPVCQH